MNFRKRRRLAGGSDYAFPGSGEVTGAQIIFTDERHGVKKRIK
jgi:hypothetical protein